MKMFGVALTALALLLAVASPARADVGVESSSRKAGSPGDRVQLTVGCGFCFPPCVGEAGHHHPPGDPHGPCMLGTRREPPASFPVWLTPLRHSLDRYRCDPEEQCLPGSARPPRLPSFVYLGVAVPPPEPDQPAERAHGPIPRYRLVFGVPEARPGRYKYVLFCDACVDGPRGTLIQSPTLAAGRLRVLPPAATASGDAGGGTLSWIAAGTVAIALVLGAVILRRNGSRPHPGRAA